MLFGSTRSLPIISSLKENLCIPSPPFLLGDGLGRVEFSDGEVRQVASSVESAEDDVRFEVAMDNVILVKKFDARSDLSHPLGDLAWVEV